MVRPAARARGERGLPQLSMGTTQDFAVAVEEGATIVRIGTSLFAERSPGDFAGKRPARAKLERDGFP